MRRIRVTLSHKVPTWGFCNSDHIDLSGEVSTSLCRFCSKSKAGYRCLLYDTPLMTEDRLVSKSDGCMRASAGFASVIEEANIAPPQPSISPKDLIKQTMDLYSKTVNDLLNQGYPRPIAEATAKQFILGG